MTEEEIKNRMRLILNKKIKSIEEGFTLIENKLSKQEKSIFEICTTLDRLSHNIKVKNKEN